MTDIKGDPRVIERIIEARFKSVTGLMEDWDERYGDGTGEDVPARSSFFRWRKGALPRTDVELLKWAALLDLDPAALIEMPTSRFKAMVEAVAAKFAFGRLDKAFDAYVGRMITPSPFWPPDDMVRPAYGNAWHVVELAHDPKVRKDFTACIEIASPGWDGIAPRAFHFAYRRSVPDAMFWTPYGTVIRDETTVRLFHSSAPPEEKPAPEIGLPARVGTYFGLGAAEFRIACLHPFEARVGPDVDLNDIVIFK